MRSEIQEQDFGLDKRRSRRGLLSGRYRPSPTSTRSDVWLSAALEHLQSEGQFGPRDFGKVMFNLPIPTYSEKVPEHRALTAPAERASRIAAKVPVDDARHFQSARKAIRAALAKARIDVEIDQRVSRLFSAQSVRVA